jgi:hypothetical protein
MIKLTAMVGRKHRVVSWRVASDEAWGIEVVHLNST